MEWLPEPVGCAGTAVTSGEGKASLPILVPNTISSVIVDSVTFVSSVGCAEETKQL